MASAYAVRLLIRERAKSISVPQVARTQFNQEMIIGYARINLPDAQRRNIFSFNGVLHTNTPILVWVVNYRLCLHNCSEHMSLFWYFSICVVEKNKSFLISARQLLKICIRNLPKFKYFTCKLECISRAKTDRAFAPIARWELFT
jgi:hypothetical protein